MGKLIVGLVLSGILGGGYAGACFLYWLLDTLLRLEWVGWRRAL